MSHLHHFDDLLTGLPPSVFGGQSNGSIDSGDTDEARSSPTGSSGGSNHEMTLGLVLDNTGASEATPAQNQELVASEMPEAQWSAYNTTPNGLVNTCGYLDAFGVLCGKTVPRQDRFKHHVQTHFGVKPYACADSNKIAPELKCNRTFSSRAERDTHVRNKVPVACTCTKEMQPKNLARHKKICQIYLASLDTETSDS